MTSQHAEVALSLRGLQAELMAAHDSVSHAAHSVGWRELRAEQCTVLANRLEAVADILRRYSRDSAPLFPPAGPDIESGVLREEG